MQRKPNFDLSKFTFRYDNVLVKALREEKQKILNKKTGEEMQLIKPDQYDEKPEFGEVVAIGEGRVLDNGQVLSPKVKVGDIVFFGKYSSEQTRSLGQDYYIIREEDIRAVK